MNCKTFLSAFKRGKALSLFSMKKGTQAPLIKKEKGSESIFACFFFLNHRQPSVPMKAFPPLRSWMEVMKYIVFLHR